MFRAILAFMLALSAGWAEAKTPSARITGPTQVVAGSTFLLDARESVSDKEIRWKVNSTSVKYATFDQQGRVGVMALISSIEPGVYQFIVVARGVPEGMTELDADASVHIVTVTGQAPTPTPLPTPPGPSPQPQPEPAPPGPTPVPDPVPVPAPTIVTNLRVLVLHEAQDVKTWPQWYVVNSKPLRAYLTTRCMTDGGLPAWRVWDDDIDTANETEGWKAAVAVAKATPESVPKIAIFDDVKLVKVIPIPTDANEAAIIEEIQLYGGR